MLSSSKYHLFVSNKCCGCDRILDHLNKEKIVVRTTNIDHDEYHLPFPITILPALVLENKLISYGVDDIIERLKKT